MTKETLTLALEALNKLADAAGGFSVSGVYFNEGVWEQECLNAAYEAIKALEEALAKQEQGEPVAIDGNTSDGYHTFNELYDFRKAYNAALFNEWSAGGKCSVHKSWRHHDGELCFGGGWFIVVAVLPDGQISNHYEAKDWDLFSVPETERALFEFDGHTGNDVIKRLKSYLPQPKQEQSEPVAWMTIDSNGEEDDVWYENPESKLLEGWTFKPLYTTPQPAQKPLTDEQIKELVVDHIGMLSVHGGVWRVCMNVARAIEAAHGIKENT